ncbi:MAG: glycosyltransferase family 4 protein [Pseudomonadota bacterium]
MHILITVNASFNAVNFRRGLIEALVEDGHSITVLAPRDERSSQLTDMGCRFVPLIMDVKGLSPLKDTALVARLAGHFRREKPDIVFGFTIKNNIFGGLAARLTGVPFVPCITGLGTAFLSGALLQSWVQMLYREAFRKVPSVIFQNRDDLDLFVQEKLVKPAQTCLVPGSGIDLSRFSPTPGPDRQTFPTFLMISRLLKDKGVLEYVEAARLVKRDHPGATFQILGPIGSKNRSVIDADSVDTWTREGVIAHLGSTEDVRPFIAAADCVVLPSYREGAPRTLIEAAAMGRPLIATDVPGCRSVVDDGENGFLCKVRSGESLADACKRFVSLSYAQRKAMGKAGRQKMEREFDQALVIAQYRQILDDLGSISSQSKADSLSPVA